MPTIHSYRKPINLKQLEILDILYRFRFATPKHLTQAFNLKPSSVNERLSLLVDQNYIGRRFDSAYRLRGQSASYHLLPAGIAALKQQPRGTYRATELKKMYKDRDASDRFVAQWLSIFDLYVKLSAHYGNRLRPFTASELAKYTYFPSPRPHLFLRLSTLEGERQFFLEYLDDFTEPFIAMRRIRYYMNYAENGEWEAGTTFPFPTILFICEADRLSRRLYMYTKAKMEDDMDDDLNIQFASKEKVLLSLEPKE